MNWDSFPAGERSKEKRSVGAGSTQSASLRRTRYCAANPARDDFLTNGRGDVKKLRPPRDELRLRVGDYRVFFYHVAPLSIRITGVKHRSEAYT